MQANDIQFLTFLDGQKQYLIPIYQRTYSWTLAECGQLWKDIVRAATNDNVPAHFIGSIVHIAQDSIRPVSLSFS